MKIEKTNPNIKYVYHYTSKQNVEKILDDKAIKSKDQYVFFTKSLKDSIVAFEREMMRENKWYIDVEGRLRKRAKCNKEDYCILKIPYTNDNQFYTFNFENQSDESIYTISISHKGSYRFKEAKVLEFPKNRKRNILCKTAAVAVAAGVMLFPHNVYAADWLDANNYDISWYASETASEYVITTAKQMAGLAHLVNNEGKTFAGKYIRLDEDIDLTANTWVTIEDIFNGTICGGHRIILNYLDGEFAENKDISVVEYLYKVLEDKNTEKYVAVKKPYTVEKMKESAGVRAVFLNNISLYDNQTLLGLRENDIIEVFTGNYNLFIKNAQGINEAFEFESGDSIDNVKTKYSERVNVPKYRIVLEYNGRRLDDERTLADYNIQKYEVLDAYVKFAVNTSVEEGKGTIISSQDTALPGEKITITLNPDSEYEFSKLIVNGIDKTSEVQNNELSIECGDEDINVKVSYRLKESGDEDIDVEVSYRLKESGSQDNAEGNVSSNNPKTGDGTIIKYILAFIVSMAGVLTCTGKKITEKRR